MIESHEGKSSCVKGYVVFMQFYAITGHIDEIPTAIKCTSVRSDVIYFLAVCPFLFSLLYWTL